MFVTLLQPTFPRHFNNSSSQWPFKRTNFTNSKVCFTASWIPQCTLAAAAHCCVLPDGRNEKKRMRANGSIFLLDANLHLTFLKWPNLILIWCTRTCVSHRCTYKNGNNNDLANQRMDEYVSARSGLKQSSKYFLFNYILLEWMFWRCMGVGGQIFLVLETHVMGYQV